MSARGHLFWVQFHRSDASAGFRWLLMIVAALALMPVLGSFLSVILIGGGLIGWLYLHFDREWIEFDRTERIIAITIVGYMGVTLAFALLGRDPVAGIDSVWNNVPLLIMLPLLPVLRFFFREYWEEWILRAVIAGGILVGITATAEGLLAYQVRPQALTGNSLILAYLAATTALLNLSLATGARGTRAASLVAAGLMSSFAVFMSGGRGPLLSLLATSLCVVLPLAIAASLRRSRLMISIAAVSAIVIAAGYASLQDTTSARNVVERFVTLMNVATGDTEMVGDYSVETRVELYEAGWAAFLEKPLLGYGRQNVMRVANEQFDDDAYFPFTQLHNGFLTEAVASGILGPLAFAAVLMLPIVAAWRAKPAWLAAGITHTVFVTLFSMTNLGFYHDIKVCHFMFVICLLNAVNPHRRAAPREPDTNDGP